MVDSGFLKTFKDSISHMPTPRHVLETGRSENSKIKLFKIAIEHSELDFRT